MFLRDVQSMSWAMVVMEGKRSSWCCFGPIRAQTGWPSSFCCHANTQWQPQRWSRHQAERTALPSTTIPIVPATRAARTLLCAPLRKHLCPTADVFLFWAFVYRPRRAPSSSAPANPRRAPHISTFCRGPAALHCFHRLHRPTILTGP